MELGESDQASLHGDLLHLWDEAQKDFIRRATNKHVTLPTSNLLHDPMKWVREVKKEAKLSILKSFRHKRLFNAIAKHISRIQTVLNALTATVQFVSGAVPAAAPAAFVVQALAGVFQLWVKSRQRLERIEAFFQQTELMFKDISVLGDVSLQGKRLLSMRECLLEMFSCCLQICAIAIDECNERFGKRNTLYILNETDNGEGRWLKCKLTGDGDLDNLFGTLKDLKERLKSILSGQTYVEVREIRSHLNRRDRDDILSWLSPLTFEKHHSKLIQDTKNRPSTGKWLLDSKEFKNWKNHDGSKLWYTGKPGAGKSILASIIIRHLQKLADCSDEHTLMFLYMNHAKSPTVRDYLGSMLRQVVSRMEHIPVEIQEEWRKQAKFGREVSGELVSQPDLGFLQSQLSSVTVNCHVYIIVDAMDECAYDIRREVMNAIKAIKSSSRILITARLLEDGNELSNGFKLLPIAAKYSDIDDFLDHEMRHEPIFNDLSKAKFKFIKMIIILRARRMFLLAKLHMNALKEITREDQIDQVLFSLPIKVDESYSTTLSRIDGRETRRQEQAYRILGWLSHALRELHFQELNHALSISVQLEFNENISEVEPMFEEREMESICCGLVEIGVDGIVRFVHYSAEKFFQGKRDITFPEFRREIPLSCAKYLSIKKLQAAFDEDGVEAMLSSFPLAHYIAEYFHQHFRLVRHAERTDRLFYYTSRLLQHDTFFRLISDRGIYYTGSSALESHWDPVIDGNANVLETPQMHLAAFLGCPELVRLLVEKDLPVSCVDKFGQSPLVVAFKRGFEDVAECLLDSGAMIDLCSRAGHILTLYAARNNFHGALNKILGHIRRTELSPLAISSSRLLLFPATGWISSLFYRRAATLEVSAEPGADRKARALLERHGRVLLSAYNGATEDVRKHLSVYFPSNARRLPKTHTKIESSWRNKGFASSIDVQDYLDTACFLAVEKGHTQVVKLLLERGVKPDLKDHTSQSLLHRATFRNSYAIVKHLLDLGACVDPEDSHGRTPFTANPDRDHEQVLNLLKERGANIDHRDKSGVHELYRAAAFGNKAMVEFFLENGVVASITNKFGWTPLHEASANAHIDCVRLLLKWEAQTSPISDLGMTPLDLVNAREPHYDWPCLGEDSQHYLRGTEIRFNLQALEDLEAIRTILVEQGAKTSDALYAGDRGISNTQRKDISGSGQEHISQH